MALLPTNIATGNSSHIAYTNQVNKKTNAWVDVVADYGATGDGVADDTAEIQAAIAAVPSIGGMVLFPPGSYKISSTILLQSRSDLHLSGRGATLVWAGANNIPALKLLGSRECLIDGFRILSTPATPLQTALQTETLSGFTTVRCGFRDITIEGTSLNGLNYGYRSVAGTGGDANNSEHEFSNVVVYNYTDCGFSFEHAQSKAHMLYNCGAVGTPSATASSGISTRRGTGSQGGSFTWYGGALTRNSYADIDLGEPNDYIQVYNMQSENSQRLLMTVGPNGAFFPVWISGVRWAQNPGDTLIAGNKFIEYKSMGPLSIQGCEFAIATAKAAEVHFNPGGVQEDAQFEFSNNYIRTTRTNPFTGFQPTVSFGNLIDRDGGAGTVAVHGAQLFKKSTIDLASPGAGNLRLYVRDGTNASTLKLVVRAGLTGAETTVLDNIPT